MARHYKPKTITNGLVLFLDAGSQRSYPGTGNSWYDRSGKGNNGTLINSPTFDTNNKGSIVLNGSNHISIADSTDLNNNIFTFCCWLKNDATDLYWNRIISKKNAYTDINGYEISLETETSTNIYISGAGNEFAIIDTINWISTGWHHLCVTFNNTIVSVYCDGIYKGQGNISPVVSNTRPLYIGKIESENTTQWNGKISNVSMYNYILSPEEIFSNYSSLRSRYVDPIIPTPASGNNIKLENDGYVLLENGSKIVTEISSVDNTILLENGIDFLMENGLNILMEN